MSDLVFDPCGCKIRNFCQLVTEIEIATTTKQAIKTLSKILKYFLPIDKRSVENGGTGADAEMRDPRTLKMPTAYAEKFTRTQEKFQRRLKIVYGGVSRMGV